MTGVSAARWAFCALPRTRHGYSAPAAGTAQTAATAFVAAAAPIPPVAALVAVLAAAAVSVSTLAAAAIAADVAVLRAFRPFPVILIAAFELAVLLAIFSLVLAALRRTRWDTPFATAPALILFVSIAPALIFVFVLIAFAFGLAVLIPALWALWALWTLWTWGGRPSFPVLLPALVLVPLSRYRAPALALILTGVLIFPPTLLPVVPLLPVIFLLALRRATAAMFEIALFAPILLSALLAAPLVLAVGLAPISLVLRLIRGATAPSGSFPALVRIISWKIASTPGAFARGIILSPLITLIRLIALIFVFVLAAVATFAALSLIIPWHSIPFFRCVVFVPFHSALLTSAASEIHRQIRAMVFQNWTIAIALHRSCSAAGTIHAPGHLQMQARYFSLSHASATPSQALHDQRIPVANCQIFDAFCNAQLSGLRKPKAAAGWPKNGKDLPIPG
jgi:hypothetical protein